jgi:hypothetical protein
MTRWVTLGWATVGTVALVGSATLAGAQAAQTRVAAAAAPACDTAGARTALAAMATYDRPFTTAGGSTVRARHAVAGSGAASTRKTSSRARLAPGSRVRAQADGEVVSKDRIPVRKDSSAWCPQVAATPEQPVFEVPTPFPRLTPTDSAPGEVVPNLGVSVARRGRFFLPPLLGGALLGGSAIALANRPRSGPEEAPFVPVTPTLPGTPLVPPTTPTAPGTPATPTSPAPTSPTTVVPPTPTTPVVPATPDTPVAPTETVPEPATVVLLAGGLAALGAAGRRRRRAAR